LGRSVSGRGLEFRAYDSEFRVEILGSGDQGLGDQGLGAKVQGSGNGV